MELKTGDIIFVMHNDNLISKLIAKAMGSKWSHSALVYGNMNGRALLCETSDFEVTLNWFDRYLKDKNVSLEVYRHKDHYNVINGNEEVIQDMCDSILGKMYGYLQLISLGIRRLCKLRIPNFIYSGLVCCHVVGYGLNVIKDSGFDGIDPESFDTEEMYQMIKSKGWIEIFRKERKL